VTPLTLSLSRGGERERCGTVQLNPLPSGETVAAKRPGEGSHTLYRGRCKAAAGRVTVRLPRLKT
jgi:hypothetical protein